MVPRNEKENLEVVDIAEDYYQVVIMMIREALKEIVVFFGLVFLNFL